MIILFTCSILSRIDLVEMINVRISLSNQESRADMVKSVEHVFIPIKALQISLPFFLPVSKINLQQLTRAMKNK